MTNPPSIVWLRRDLRLHDHPAFQKARRAGGPVIPLFIYSPDFEGLGAAAKWRLGESVAHLREDLARIGSKLILRRGDPQTVLDDVMAETGARRVVWSRAYDAASIARDAAIKSRLHNQGHEALSVYGTLLFEPWTVETGKGTMFKVYSPFWRAVRDMPVATPYPAITSLNAPAHWPASDELGAWQMGAAMGRGAAVLARHTASGEAAALDKLAAFMDGPIARYKERRDFMAEAATSGQSEHLTTGEISPRQLWHSGQAALAEGKPGAEHFLKELVWREFAWHLMFHTPHIATSNWRPEWDGFAWRGAGDDAVAWQRGHTGIAIVDAAMRELYVTGRMHNRARMIAASFLTKHLLVDWRVGQAWFGECLTDWDAASNAMGWQWVAGSGPDAAPYFRIFNPELQAARFDPDGHYRARWLAHWQETPENTALDFYRAVPKSWGLDPGDRAPAAIIGLAEGRARALMALENSKSK